MSDTETKPTHTPGPWEISQWAKHHPRAGFPASICQNEDADDSAFVCFLDGNNDMATEWANARLIASAPELLASLKAMVRYFDTFYDRLTPHDVAVKVAADTAIAKAEGNVS
jgi:hypothetical protein